MVEYLSLFRYFLILWEAVIGLFVGAGKETVSGTANIKKIIMGVD